MEKGTDIWLCNTVKTIDGMQTQICCHMRYHTEIKRNTGSATDYLYLMGIR